MKSKFDKNSTLEKILEKPGAEEILAKYNLPCLSCPMAAFEIKKLEIGEVCKMYGLPFKKMIEELNKIK